MLKRPFYRLVSVRFIVKWHTAGFKLRHGVRGYLVDRLIARVVACKYDKIRLFSHCIHHKRTLFSVPPACTAEQCYYSALGTLLDGVEHLFKRVRTVSKIAYYGKVMVCGDNFHSALYAGTGVQRCDCIVKAYTHAYCGGSRKHRVGNGEFARHCEFHSADIFPCHTGKTTAVC